MRDTHPPSNMPPKKRNRLVEMGLMTHDQANAESVREISQNKGESQTAKPPLDPSGKIPEKSPVETTLNFSRQEQLEIGKLTEKRFDELFTSELMKNPYGDNPMVEEEKRSRGRPKLAEKNTEKNSINLHKKYWEFLDRVTFKEKPNPKKKRPKKRPDGYGTKIRKIIDRYLIYMRREQEQIKVLSKPLYEMEKDLKLFLSKYKAPEHIQEVDAILMRLKNNAVQFETVRGILKIDLDELAELLTPTQMKNLDLVKTIVINREKNSSGELPYIM